MKSMKRYGQVWSHDGETWEANNGRFKFLTWPFGSIHQCVVEVEYDHRIEGKTHHGCRGSQIHIGLQAQKTRDASMKRAIKWAKEFADSKPKSAEQVFTDCFTNWRTLYRTRLDVIGHIFFTIGNGYDWIDGNVVYTNPDSHLEIAEREAWQEKNDEGFMVRARKLEKEATPIGPLPDDGEKKAFCPASKNYSLVSIVPDDVTDEWLAIAYEAAKALAERSGCPDNKYRRQCNFFMEALCEEMEKENPGMTKDREWFKKDREPDLIVYSDDDRTRQTENVKLGKEIVSELERRFKDRLGK